MRLKIVNLWKEKIEFPQINILVVGNVDMQYYIVILNFSFIVEL